ncbi:hypothetical protein SAMN05421856_10791 [Chryseobacterium taichungense]|uniref:Uncharacterized protein n=1 Tax=Chryseobacterium taichungense TaxID=295069 RepID=A0A1H8BML8_9FLAO|nr:hypothetical protein SAMN05421856_10791 [Chryseobacterium taichungense]
MIPQKPVLKGVALSKNVTHTTLLSLAERSAVALKK